MTRPTPSERQIRIDLAAAYRLAAQRGWDDTIYTHLSAGVPGEPVHYLINPIGARSDEICAISLVKVDVDGRAEQARLAANLGTLDGLILDNHGTLTVGRTVAEAWMLSDLLDRAAQAQLTAMAGAAAPPGPQLARLP